MSSRARGSWVAERLLAAAALLVPRSARDEWRREWAAELWSRAQAGRPVVGPSLGAFRHALWMRRQAAMHASALFLHDLRFAARALSRRPLFAASAITTFALGLGATTAVYSVVDRVLLAPLPYPGSDRLVLIEETRVGRDTRRLTLSPETFTVWREHARGFEAFEAYLEGSANLVGAGAPSVVGRARVTPGFLADLLGVEPLRGRGFDAWEETEVGPNVALISERLWLERFGGRNDALGRRISVNGRSMEVIGILPRVAILPDVDIWVPEPLPVNHESTRVGSLVGIGRLRPGVTLDAALADLNAAIARVAPEYPKSIAPFAPELSEYRAGLVRDVRLHLLILLGAVVVVLLIACVNVTNLLLARAVERAEELAVRRSLGASTSQLATYVLAESAILAVAGGLGGVMLALGGVKALVALIPTEFPLAETVSVDGRVLAFAALVTVGTALLVASLPMARIARDRSPAPGRERSATPRRRSAGQLLLGLEVAQAAALLVAAGLLVNTLWRRSTAEPGFETQGLLFAHLDLPSYAYAADPDDVEPRLRFLQQLRARLLDLPEVSSVGLATATPFSGITYLSDVVIEGGFTASRGNGGIGVSEGSDEVYFSRIHVDLDYLSTLGLPIVEGRSFRPSDQGASNPVALVNETAARDYWPGVSAIGRRLQQGSQWLTVVGVVADFGHPGLPTHHIAELYQLLEPGAVPAGDAIDGSEALGSMSRPTVLVRHAGDGEEMVERVRRAIWSVDPELPIPAVATADRELGTSLVSARFYALLMGLFATLALVLASVGIYGVVAGSVARRKREIGIRVALGAGDGRVLRMVVGDAMSVVLTALAIGLSAGALGSRLLQGLLYGVRPTDPSTYAAAAALLTGVAATAILIPARRVLRADPCEALRSE
jgi:putative ABC transport system permease protein